MNWRSKTKVSYQQVPGINSIHLQKYDNILPLKTGLVTNFVEFLYLNDFVIKDTVGEQSKNSKYPTSRMQNKAS